MHATTEEIIAIIQGVGVAADVSGLKEDTSLRDAGIDSVEMFTVLLAIEEKFGIKIPDADVGRLDTAGDIVCYLLGR